MAALMVIALLVGIVGATYAVWRVGTRDARLAEVRESSAESPIEAWRRSRLGPVTSAALGLPHAVPPVVAHVPLSAPATMPSFDESDELEEVDEGPVSRRRELERQALADEEARAALAREHDEDDEDWMAERFGGAWAGFGGSTQLYD